MVVSVSVSPAGLTRATEYSFGRPEKGDVYTGGKRGTGTCNKNIRSNPTTIQGPEGCIILSIRHSSSPCVNVQFVKLLTFTLF